MKKKTQTATEKFRRIDPRQIQSSPSLFLTPKQWAERWQTKMQHAIQMAR